MHHTVANSASATDATLVDLTPVPDQIIVIANAHFFPQRRYSVVMAAVFGTNAQRSRIVTPRLRQLNPPWIRPLNAALIGLSNAAIADWRRQPLQLNAMEEVQIDYQQTSGGAQRGTVIMNWQTEEQQIPMGDIFTLRGTATTTLVANAWSLLTVTWESNLPAGVYAVVWGEVQSTNGQAFRLIIENQNQRPGMVCIPTVLSRKPDVLPVGAFGEWGRFRNTAIPLVEVLANVADTAQEIYLYLVQVEKLSY